MNFSEHVSSIPEPDHHAPTGRQRAFAQVLPINVSQVVKDIGGPHPFEAVRQFDRNYMYGAVFGSPSFPSFCGFVERESLKRKAEEISRSESEVVSFLMHNTTSQEQAKQLLEIITNLSSYLIERNHYYCDYCD